MRPIEMQVLMVRTVDTSQMVSQNQQVAIAAQQNKQHDLHQKTRAGNQ